MERQKKKEEELAKMNSDLDKAIEMQKKLKLDVLDKILNSPKISQLRKQNFCGMKTETFQPLVYPRSGMESEYDPEYIDYIQLLVMNDRAEYPILFYPETGKVTFFWDETGKEISINSSQQLKKLLIEKAESLIQYTKDYIKDEEEWGDDDLEDIRSLIRYEEGLLKEVKQKL